MTRSFAAAALALLILSKTVAQEVGPPVGWTTCDSSSPCVTTLTASCAIAAVNIETNAVTVDWPCVEHKDREYLAGKSKDIYGVVAHVMLAVRDGKARNR